METKNFIVVEPVTIDGVEYEVDAVVALTDEQVANFPEGTITPTEEATEEEGE